MENNVQETIEEVVKTSSKSKIGKRLLIIGGAVAGLALGGWWLSKKSNIDELDDFEDEYDFEEEEDTEDSEEESTEE